MLAYLLLPGPKTDLAEALLDQQPQWAAPPLWRSEFRNVLTGYLRRDRLLLSQAVELMQEAEEILSAHNESVSTELVLQLVSTSTCSAKIMTVAYALNFHVNWRRTAKQAQGDRRPWEV